MKWTTAFGLILVLIANIGKCEEVSPAVQKYEREAFGAWIDQDDDCQNTRHELLISRSIKGTKLRPDNCLVKSGQWFDPYSGDHIFAAIELDIDHLVPLKFAWVHGASHWQTDKLVKFANDPENLIITQKTYNRSKGSRGPLEWLPPLDVFRCEYISKFSSIMSNYGLLFKLDEKEKIDNLIGSFCH